MALVPLTGGAYVARALIANAQRCVNVYPERNDEQDQAPAPTTHYLSPGLLLLAQGVVAPVRGLFEASNGDCFAVIGANVYYVAPNWALTLLGSMTTTSGVPYTATTPVSMDDNGTTLVLVDGSDQGYTITLATRAFAILVDAGGTFAAGGASRVRYLSTFFIFNRPDTRSWFVSLSDSTTIDPTDVAEKNAYSDKLASIEVMHRELWLVGQKTTEIWFVSGESFPFSSIPGAYADHGTVAPNSVAASDLSIFLIGRDKQGKAVVFRGSGYKYTRISNHAIEHELQSYPRIDDAVGFVFQIDGHVFYHLWFPTADKSWRYDDATKLWHEVVFVDNDGNEHAHRASCFSTMYGKLIVGDRQNGMIYELSDTVYTDNTQPIVRRRSFPHMKTNGKLVQYGQFVADMATGTDPNNVSTLGLQVTLRWSDDGGRTWGNGVPQTLGAGGAYNTQLSWSRLGQGRDRVFELIWSVPTETGLNGAYVEALPLQK